MPGSVSTNRHVCSEKYDPNNVSVRKIEIERVDSDLTGNGARGGTLT